MPKKESKGWISVDEDLPEEEGNYLVSMEDGDVCEAYFVEDFLFPILSSFALIMSSL